MLYTSMPPDVRSGKMEFSEGPPDNMVLDVDLKINTIKGETESWYKQGGKSAIEYLCKIRSYYFLFYP